MGSKERSKEGMGSKRGRKRGMGSKERRKRHMGLREFVAAGFLKPGRKVLSVRGQTGHVLADLTAEGLIVYNGTEFRSPTGFASAALQRTICNGWRETVYKASGHPEKWKSLDSLRPKCVYACVCVCEQQEPM